MRGAQFLLQEEEKALLRETRKFFNKFRAGYGHVSAQKEEEEHDDSAVFDDSQFFDGEDDNDDFSDESSLQQSSIERNMYWESQEALLQEILEHYSSSGSKLREEIKKLIEIARGTNFCDCKGPPQLGGCANCLRGRVENLLCAKGFHASLCTSEWKRTQKFPGGRHDYIELIARSQGKKRKIKFLIEMEFRDEFKMANACDEYKKLIELLPETYIGKPEHLNAVVRIMCDAAKKSSTEKKIYMGPWRKKSFMKMKWSASHENEERIANESSSSHVGLVSSQQNDVDRVFPLTAPTAVRVA